MEDLTYSLLEKLSKNPEKVLDMHPIDLEIVQNYLFLLKKLEKDCEEIGYKL